MNSSLTYSLDVPEQDERINRLEHELRLTYALPKDILRSYCDFKEKVEMY